MKLKEGNIDLKRFPKYTAVPVLNIHFNQILELRPSVHDNKSIKSEEKQSRLNISCTIMLANTKVRSEKKFIAILV